MVNVKRILSLYILVVLVLSCSQANESDTLRVLFIGNSYTYYNSSPELFRKLMQEQLPNKTVESKLISGGGMTLADHWRDNATVETIRTGGWDYAVLQEQSKLGMGVIVDNSIYFGPTERFYEHAKKLDSEITQAGAKTVFLMTWAGRNKAGDQAILSHAYSTIARERDAILAPVGLVWESLRDNSNFDLYADDGGHPSAHGSYLLAVTLVATLTNQDPMGLAHKISGLRLSNRGEPSQNEEVLIDVPKEDAMVIQEASWEVLESIRRSSEYLDFEEPIPSYTIPSLEDGDKIDLEILKGNWYGTSTYSSDYHGHLLQLDDLNANPKLSIISYSAHSADTFDVKDFTIEDRRIIINVFDSRRQRSSEIKLVLDNDQILGVLDSPGNFRWIKNMEFSRDSNLNGIDLAALNNLTERFQAKISEEGYIRASVKRYQEYSKAIGKPYIPEEYYLIAIASNYLEDNRKNAALRALALANHYYPQSIFTLQRYSESLLMAGQKDKAIDAYEKAIDLAQKSASENLTHLKEMLNQLKNSPTRSTEREGLPPPPPPPGH